MNPSEIRPQNMIKKRHNYIIDTSSTAVTYALQEFKPTIKTETNSLPSFTLDRTTTPQRQYHPHSQP